ncbi:response regulator transcription factor [Vibrio hippocampi]|uniref:Virulence factors putative positive transcription regulator BvgA n=1 Tax=Vibrio hippocampi TaxID=654686 RepID=A0ABN8DN86_9VIBR|nr:response regulator transcription factor [Vibrio hippocampi]CAH0529983.1 Virulence factors putative positive transcription regulator BvgA [Vibrio hippocampi]
MANKTYLLIDHQPLFSDAVEQLINDNFQPKEIIKCDDATTAYQWLRDGAVDVLILDIELKEGNGIELVKRVRKAGFAGLILFISSQSYETYSSLAKSVGAQGYVSKTELQSTIIKALKAVELGYSFFKTSVTTDLPEVKLSKRELSVLNYLSQGYSNKDISQFLYLSEKTISTYKTRLLKKYKANSLVHLLNSAAAHNSITSDMSEIAIQPF